MRPGVRYAHAFVLAACVASTSPVWAQEEDRAFKDGLEARKKQQWGEVVAQMRKAIAADGRESARKVKTGVFASTEYLPYYYLGEAYQRQGDCANAVVSWATSEQHGIVKQKGDFVSAMRQGMTACEAKGVLLPGKFDPLAAKANQQIAELRTRFARVKELGEQHADIWRGTAAFGETYGRALAEDQSARSHLNAAFRTRTEKEFTEVGQAAARANGLLEGLEGDFKTALSRLDRVSSLRTEVQRAVQDGRSIDAEIEAQKNHLTPALAATRADGMKALARAADQVSPRTATEATATAARALANEGLEQLRGVQSEINKKLTEAMGALMEKALGAARETFAQVDAAFSSLDTLLLRPVKDGTDVAGLRDAARKKFEAARRRLGAAQRTNNLKDVGQATAIAAALLTELQGLQSHFGELSLADLGVPAWLQQGADRYFKGDYGQALEILAIPATTDPKLSEAAKAHAHMLRAAAQHALWVRSGEKDTARRDQAVTEIRACKSITPNFVPDRRWFSSRFLEFFERGGASPAAAQASR
ncbi:MAG TPA: hypothetical protein VMF13_04360 [Luteitalea sp.]|nr:hypothetical protein [Luteitalea sp.]